MLRLLSAGGFEVVLIWLCGLGDLKLLLKSSEGDGARQRPAFSLKIPKSSRKSFLGSFLRHQPILWNLRNVTKKIYRGIGGAPGNESADPDWKGVWLCVHRCFVGRKFSKDCVWERIRK